MTRDLLSDSVGTAEALFIIVIKQCKRLVYPLVASRTVINGHCALRLVLFTRIKYLPDPGLYADISDFRFDLK